MSKNEKSVKKARSKAPQAPKLGNRNDIRLIGICPSKGRSDEFTAYYYSGMRSPDGHRHMVVHRLGAANLDEARRIAEGKLTQIQAEWDRHASTMLIELVILPAPPATSPRLSLDTSVNQALAMMEGHAKPSASFGYKTAAGHFLHQAGALAKMPAAACTETDCVRIRNGMLADLDPSSFSPRQLMLDLRSVLWNAAQFDEDLVYLFHPPAGLRKQSVVHTQTFLPSEMRALIQNLDQTDWTTRGLCLLAANSGAPVGDIAFVTWQQLCAASSADSVSQRAKAGKLITGPMWEDTQAWLNERPRVPGEVYVFPELVFTTRELAKNPSINHAPLDRRSARDRILYAVPKALKKFREYLRLCGIHRPGVSFRSFRRTTMKSQ